MKHAHRVMDCEDWAALLADKMDGTLPPEREAEFAAHAASCASCGLLLEEAERGREWLQLLGEDEAEPPVQLLSKILAQTGAAGRATDHPLGSFAGVHPGAHGWHLPAGHLQSRQVRFLMTAGMAFFSVALTLSMLGVHLAPVHAAELKPGVVEAGVSRSFYGTKKQVVSFYENLRFVYEVEARVRAMRRDGEQMAPQAQPPEQKPATKPRGHASAEPDESQDWRGTPVLAQVRTASPGVSGEERGGL